MITSIAPMSENLIASKLIQKYKDEGFTVITKPHLKDLPFDLGLYKPDLLIQKQRLYR